MNNMDEAELETSIRRSLKLYAAEAPTTVALDGDQQAATRPGRHWLLQPVRLVPMLAAAVLGVGVGGWFVTFGGPSGQQGPGDAQCAAVLDFDGARWTPIGDVYRMPSSGGPAGDGTIPGCSDGGGASTLDRTVRVDHASGYAAVLAEGEVWARSSAQLSSELRALRVAPECESGGTAVVQVESAVSQASPQFDGDLSKPLTLLVRSEDPVLTTGEWQWVRTLVKVPRSARSEPAEISTMLTEGIRADLDYHCERGVFVADALTPTAS